MISRFVRISSHDRDLEYKTESSSEFTVRFRQASNLQKVHSIVVKQIAMCNTFENIGSHNNYFAYSIDGVVFQHTVPAGQYTLNQLKDLLTGLFNTDFGGSVATLSFDYYKSQMIFSFPSTNVVKFLYKYNSQDSYRFWELIGFNDIQQFDIPNNVVSESKTGLILATSIPDLISTHTAYISSKILSNSGYDGDSAQINVIGAVPIRSAFGAYSYYDSSSESLDRIIFPSPRNLQEIDIRVRDSTGRILDTQNINWSMLLKVYCTI